MSAIRWLLHDAIFKDRLPEMTGILDQRGDEAVLLSGRNPALPEPDGRPAIGLVTLQVARRIHSDGKLSPGVFWRPNAFDQTTWSAYLGAYCLNDDIMWLPWAEFVRRGALVCVPFAVDGKVFLKPSSGFKVFTGQTINLSCFGEDVRAMDATSSVMEETMVGVCRPKSIDGNIEWRFWLGRGGVVASTPYSWDDDIVLSDAPESVRRLAVEVASRFGDDLWMPDSVFVADFCLSEGKPRLVEVNAASCSGVYGVDLRALSEGIAEAVREEVGLNCPMPS